MLSIQASAALFDNDGVLVDSHHQVEEAWTQIAEEYNLDIDRLLSELAGVRAHDTLVRYLGEPQLSAAIDRLESIELQLADQTPAIPGSSALLQSLPAGAWTIVTSASRVLALARWAGAGITPPAAVITAEDVSRGKPDPEPFLAGAALLGVPIEDCVVFEDSDSGGRAGQTAGARVVAVGEAPWSFEPFARVKDLSEVSLELHPPTRRI